MTGENPFSKPVEATVVEAYKTPQGAPSGPLKIPASLMAIAIIGMILGAFGLFGVCAGGAGLAMTEMIIDVMPDEDAKVAMRDLLDLQFIPTLIQLGISVIVSPLLMVAGIGCLTRKSWSKGLMKLALVGSILSTLVGMGITAWMTLFHWDAINAPNAGQPGGDALTMFSQAIGIGFQVAFLIFFIWALIAMGGKTISTYYNNLSGQK
ncbi:MAG: hypothetical protein AAFN70_19460 [Planctomycetota bacterium]